MAISVFILWIYLRYEYTVQNFHLIVWGFGIKLISSQVAIHASGIVSTNHLI